MFVIYRLSSCIFASVMQFIWINYVYLKVFAIYILILSNAGVCNLYALIMFSCYCLIVCSGW